MIDLRPAPRVGEHVGRVAFRACLQAQDEGDSVAFKINKYEMVVFPGDTPGAVEKRFDRLLYEDDRKFWTPERKAARAVRMVKDQDAFTAHEETIHDLDWDDLDALIRWLCRYEEVKLVHTEAGVDVPATFLEHGFEANALLKAEDETVAEWEGRVGIDGQKRWVIGQGLNCIEFAGAPHGSIHGLANALGCNELR